MPRRRPKLQLVGHDPTDVFDDLDALGAETAAATALQRRPHQKERFAPIPYLKARKLFRHIGGPAWLLLIELDRIVFETKCNPIRLTSGTLKGSGLTRWQKERGSRLLEQAGVIRVERKRGRCPLVTHLWYSQERNSHR
jgi:hypothetical protein